MDFTITTISKHEQGSKLGDSSHTHLDVSDSALSSWAAGFRAGLHEDAIDALELGEDNGINGPAMHVYTLIDSDGIETGAELTVNAYGRQLWRLPANAASRFGRVNIPAGSNSRVQRSLGLREGRAVVAAKRIATVACAGNGCPGYLELERA